MSFSVRKNGEARKIVEEIVKIDDATYTGPQVQPVTLEDTLAAAVDDGSEDDDEDVISAGCGGRRGGGGGGGGR